ncbi:Recombination protein like [Actinidia chinensis var. chinensis]|uniref:Recombination protein like n=1 Tax=Actinidia chinensis var. chinensis TaxID=1590841 RepID=A0A2R6QHG2_ACTCC|nr:Recombination protein like [Actinidia chinensis var. chinensis]
MSLSGGGTAEGDIRGEAEGDIRGRAAAFAGDASESSHSKDVPYLEVPSRDDSVEFIGIMGKEMRRILPHIPDLTLLGSQSNSRLSPELRSDEAKKTKIGSGAYVVVVRPPIPVEGGVAKSVPSKALGPHASVMASAAMAEKILDEVILPADKKKVEKLTIDQEALAEASLKEKKAAEEIEARNKEVARLESRVAELEKSQNLAKGRIIAAFKKSEDFQEAVMDYDFLAKVEAKADENERNEFEDKDEQED